MALDFNNRSGRNSDSSHGLRPQGEKTNGSAANLPQECHNGVQRNARCKDGAPNIPWKLIIGFFMILAAAFLIMTYWDVIVYAMYKIISYLIVIFAVVTGLKMLFRRR